MPSMRWSRMPALTFVIVALVSWGFTVGPANAEPPTNYPVGNLPICATVSPDGSTLYVGAFGSGVTVIDLASGAQLATFPMNVGWGCFVVSPDGTHLWNPDYGSDIQIIDTASHAASMIPTTRYPTVVAFSPDGQSVYVSNYQDRSVTVIDVGTQKEVGTIPVGEKPWEIAFNPDGTRAYVTNVGTSTVSVIDTASKSVVATIPVGHAAAPIAVSADGRSIYVSSGSANTISVIDPATNTVTRTIPIDYDGTTLGWLALSENSESAFVILEGHSGGKYRVGKVDLASGKLVASIVIDSEAQYLAVSTDDRVVVPLKELSQVAILAFPGASAPVDLSVVDGGTASFSSTVVNHPDSLQWQVSSNGGKKYRAIAGAASATLDVTANAKVDGNLYRLAVIDASYGTILTAPAQLTVKPGPNPISVTVDWVSSADPITLILLGLFVALLVVVIVFSIVLARKRQKTST
jgi:YVTN family beta-propeller protein